MSNFIHMLAFNTRDGKVVQRADHISTIWETTGKGGAPTVFLMLANNVKLELIGETLTSVMHRLHQCGGLPVVFHREEESQGLAEMAAEAADAEPENEPEPA